MRKGAQPGDAKKKSNGRQPYFLAWGPLPPPPSPIPIIQCPHPDKKGTNLLLFQTGIHLHTHQDLKLKCCRVTAQKSRYRRPCTRDLLGTRNWLAQSHMLPFIQNSTGYFMLAQSCKFGVDCCFFGLTRPAACTRARVPLTFGHVHRPPP